VLAQKVALVALTEITVAIQFFLQSPLTVAVAVVVGKD
jgi:hypothetical protein